MLTAMRPLYQRGSRSGRVTGDSDPRHLRLHSGQDSLAQSFGPETKTIGDGLARRVAVADDDQSAYPQKTGASILLRIVTCPHSAQRRSEEYPAHFGAYAGTSCVSDT